MFFVVATTALQVHSAALMMHTVEVIITAVLEQDSAVMEHVAMKTRFVLSEEREAN